MREATPGSWTNESSPDISLREVVAPLFRHRWAWIITFLVAFGIALPASILLLSQFTSRMAILVNRERLDPLVTTQSTTQMLTQSNPVSEEEINSEAELLKSRDVLEKVVLANGLQRQHGFSFLDLFRPRQNHADRVERAVRKLARRIKVETGIKTNMIEVSYSSPDPRLSYGVLETLGNLYMDKHVAVHRPQGSYKFFAQETRRYRRAMADSESRLRSFEKQRSSAAPDLELSDLALQLANSVGQMHLAEASIAADRQRIGSDQVQMAATPRRSSTLESSSPADKLLEYLEPALLAAQTKRTQLVLKYDPQYPLVREADQEVATAKQAIAEAQHTRYRTESTDRDPTFELLREDAAKSEVDLAAQRASLAAIKRGIQSLQTQMADLGEKSLTQQDLLRDVKANEDNYLLYLSKREQERTSDALDKTRIANVAIAVPPGIPALPAHGTAYLVVLALALAAIVATAMAYLFEYFDSSFHTPAQVIDMLGIPVVVSVPKRTA